MIFFVPKQPSGYDTPKYLLVTDKCVCVCDYTGTRVTANPTKRSNHGIEKYKEGTGSEARPKRLTSYNEKVASSPYVTYANCALATLTAIYDVSHFNSRDPPTAHTLHFSSPWSQPPSTGS